MKKILFVCVENSCRSQIAEGIANNLAKGSLRAYSAGSNASGKVNPDAIKVMREDGIDISGAKSKGFEDLAVKDFDHVITLGCKDVCPFVPAGDHIEWEIEDPKGKDIETFRRVRDIIKKNVKELISKIGVACSQ